YLSIRVINLRRGKMKRVTFLFLLLLLVFVVACSDKKSNQSSEGEKEVTTVDTLKVGINAQPVSLDIHKTANILTRNIVRHMYETLITVDEDYEIVPMLAESYQESEDGKSVTFKLREGVKFHNGDEMKAADVVASMDRWLASTPPAQTVLGDAKFIEEDEYTVVMELEEASALALPVLARTSQQFAGIMP